MTDALPTEVIAGLGSVSAGEYYAIEVAGMARLQGPLRILSHVESAGLCWGSGEIEAERIEFAGWWGRRGSVTARRLEGAGRLRCHSLQVSVLRGAGAARARSLRGTDVEWEGRLRVDGDIEAERFVAKKEVRIRGLLNADHIELALSRPSFVRSMGGGEIIVRFKTGSRRLPPPGKALLRVHEIEGDTLTLVRVIARRVRGERVTVGPGCRIDRLEAVSAEIDPAARVKVFERLAASGGGPGYPPAPPGVSGRRE